MDTVQDADLLRAVAAGDRDALRSLYDLHAPWLVLRLSRRCNDSGLVDEVVQDTFLAVWRSARRWNGSGEPAAWIWGIGVRRLVDALRRRPVATVAFRDAHDDVVVSAEDLVLLGVEHGDVGAAVARLSPELRAVLQATVLDGLTTKEAGHLLGIPAGTVKTRVMRAKAALREDLA
ncbi:MAG: RNA polymerase sigma factor [Actinomycetota bacterium]|nr:RNA polymerase sigma factor [Actinomycetota bacterium]